MKELQPINENVVLDITEDKQEQKTASGIYIPETAKERKNVARVVAMANIENAEIQVGDYVLYKEYSGVESEFDDKKLLVVQYADILSKVVDTESI
ncbi:MAG: co-chaperone GroES [Bacteroidales bacterium]|nr:co-chaperone GroES [Bacteroidales bacterium]MCF8333081.1 co-chaperone GroES [Bacteroidales bacterium]